MSKRVLITGSEGFVGSILGPGLRGHGYVVQGAKLRLEDYFSTQKAVADGGPWDAVIHLASIAHVPSCEKDPSRAFEVNTAGTAHLLDAVQKYSPQAHFLYMSTAQIYAPPRGAEIQQGVTLDETRAIQPQNIYAKSKWAGEVLVHDVAKRTELRTTVMRPFNHTHFSQSTDFILPYLYAELEKIKTRSGSDAKIAVGSLDVHRDIAAVSDLVEAVAAVLEHPPTPGDLQIFNVCSGRSKHLRKLAVMLADRLGVQAEFVTDPSRIRPDEARLIVGSHDKLTKAVGWSPRVRTEEELLDYFMNGRIK